MYTVECFFIIDEAYVQDGISFKGLLQNVPENKSYKAACEFIPGFTSYRYTVANLHLLQSSCEAPVPVEHSTHLRIERDQLDHFLGFITSPHLVQDLPFGERTLSTGDTVTVPKVIRTMIPQQNCTTVHDVLPGN